MRHSPGGWQRSGVACVGSCPCPFPIPRLRASSTGSECVRSNPRHLGSPRSRVVYRIRFSSVRCRRRSGLSFRTSCTCWITAARRPSTRPGWRIDSVCRRSSACTPRRPSATAVTLCMSMGRRVRIGSIRGAVRCVVSVRHPADCPASVRVSPVSSARCDGRCIPTRRLSRSKTAGSCSSAACSSSTESASTGMGNGTSPSHWVSVPIRSRSCHGRRPSGIGVRRTKLCVRSRGT